MVLQEKIITTITSIIINVISNDVGVSKTKSWKDYVLKDSAEKCTNGFVNMYKKMMVQFLQQVHL